MSSVMGIDPGLKGAVAVINLSTGEATFWLLSAIIENRTTHFEDIISAYGVQHVYIEKAQARPGQGVSSMFNYGTGYGRIIGWVEILGIKFTLVPPQTWTKELHKGTKEGTAKQRSKEAALQLFPGTDFRASQRCVTLHDGLIDALLIAEYGRRVYKPVIEGAA